MAERRMFSKTIIDSDLFLDMPLTTQALYFHLSMRADDEGFINNPKRIQRTIGASDDDLRLLIAKQYLIPFDTGVVVVRHWKIHNYIQSDRKKATQCIEEKSQLKVENNVYEMDTECIHNAYKLDTQVSIGKVSIGKDSIGEISKGEDKKYICPRLSDLKEEFETLWSLYPKKQGKEKAKGYYEKARKSGTTYEEVEKGIQEYNDYINANEVSMRYVKQGATFFSQKAWGDDWSYREKDNGKGQGTNTKASTKERRRVAESVPESKAEFPAFKEA